MPSPAKITGSLTASVVSVGPPTVLASLRYPAPLARPGFTVRGEPVRRDDSPLGSRQISASPICRRTDAGLRRSAFLALACKSGAHHPWRARSAGPSMRYAVPASLGHRPKPFFALAVLLRSKDRGVPSVARPFTGQRVHWTLCNAPVHPWLGRSAG